MEQQGDVEMSEGPPGMLSIEGTASLTRPCLLGPEPSPEEAVVTGALVVPPQIDPTGSPTAIGGEGTVAKGVLQLHTI